MLINICRIDIVACRFNKVCSALFQRKILRYLSVCGQAGRVTRLDVVHRERFDSCIYKQ